MFSLTSLFFLLIVGAGAAGAEFGFFSPLFGLYVALAGLTLHSLLFLAAMFSASKPKKYRNSSPWLAVLFGLPCIGALGYGGYLSYQHPIPDLATDTSNPPKFDFPVARFEVTEGKEFAGKPELLDRKYPVEYGVTQAEKYPSLTGIKMGLPPSVELLASIAKAVRAAHPNWVLQLMDKEKLHLEFDAEAPYLKYMTEVAIDLRKEGKDSTSIELRSRSRYGRFDMGYNFHQLSALLEIVRKAAYDHEAAWKKQEEEKKKAEEAKAAAAEAAEAAAKAAAEAAAAAKSAPPAKNGAKK